MDIILFTLSSQSHVDLFFCSLCTFYRHVQECRFLDDSHSSRCVCVREKEWECECKVNSWFKGTFFQLWGATANIMFVVWQAADLSHFPELWHSDCLWLTWSLRTHTHTHSFTDIHILWACRVCVSVGVHICPHDYLTPYQFVFKETTVFFFSL